MILECGDLPHDEAIALFILVLVDVHVYHFSVDDLRV